ncbi:MAG: AAA family ATPase [Pseudomonadota bacterium]
MKISNIRIKNFKRFSDTTIKGIHPEAKLVLLVGPNGSGKSSLFDAIIAFYRRRSGYGHDGDEKYCRKDFGSPFDWNSNVEMQFHGNPTISKKSFYFRSAYRNEPDFNVTSFSRATLPYENLRIHRTIQNDQSVAENYTRLIYATLEGIYNETNSEKRVRELREELIGSIRRSMINVFSDLILKNVSDPLGDGAFFFQKGSVNAFHYKNLSGGEKAAFDLLLDLLIKIRYYDDTVFCIDEPEMHMHTSLQAKLVKEFVSIIPDNSQLWLATHSLGVMRAAKDLQATNTNLVCIIDFEGVNFDEEIVLNPSRIDRMVWEKFLSIAVDDLSLQFVPETVVICEGSSKGNRRKDFDAEIYSRLFASNHPDTLFVSGGSSNDISKGEFAATVLRGVLRGSKVLSLVDKDDHSSQEIADLKAKSILTLSRRNLECYLYDNEVIEKFVQSIGQQGKLSDVLKAKAMSLENSVARGNPQDDLKSAAGELYVELKKLLGLTGCGNSSDAFMRDTLAPLITPDMSVYREMERDIVDLIHSA